MSPQGGYRPTAGRKAPGGVRKPMQVMLTDSERAGLDAAAMADGGKGTSTWLRETGLAKARRRGKKS